jgi:hypothetical protein
MRGPCICKPGCELVAAIVALSAVIRRGACCEDQGAWRFGEASEKDYTRSHPLSVPDSKNRFQHSTGIPFGYFAGQDQRTASIALARILRGRQPLDQGLREILAEEIELAAQERVAFFSLKARSAAWIRIGTFLLHLKSFIVGNKAAALIKR